MPGPQPSARGTRGSVDSDSADQSQLGQVEDGLFLVHAGEPDKLIEKLSQPDCGEQRITGLQQRANLGRSRFVTQDARTAAELDAVLLTRNLTTSSVSETSPR